jgi:hypothetical protein
VSPDVAAGLVAEVQARADMLAGLIEEWGPAGNVILLGLELASADAALHAVGVGGHIQIDGQKVEIGTSR